jgi:hypothetical protein
MNHGRVTAIAVACLLFVLAYRTTEPGECKNQNILTAMGEIDAGLQHEEGRGQAIQAFPVRTEEHNAQYIISPLEAEWVNSSRVGKICETAKAQVPMAQKWMAYSQRAFNPGRKPAPPASSEENAVLSQIWTNGRLQPIEPLSGIGRHPFSQTCSLGVDIFDITYIILQNECTNASVARYPDQKTILYDLGCTKFGDGNTQTASGAGPSMPLFIRMYKDHCVDFDEIYAWEGLSYKASLWWKDVPAEWRAKIHFLNTFVEEETLEATRAGEFKVEQKDASFLKMFPLTAKPEDLVVLKVDIDGGPELQIVETIANRPDLSVLVDEMYFEYHYYYDGRNFGWGKLTAQKSHANVDHAIALMHKLRKAGVRVHFWI